MKTIGLHAKAGQSKTQDKGFKSYNSCKHIIKLWTDLGQYTFTVDWDDFSNLFTKKAINMWLRGINESYDIRLIEAFNNVNI